MNEKSHLGFFFLTSFPFSSILVIKFEQNQMGLSMKVPFVDLNELVIYKIPFFCEEG